MESRFDLWMREREEFAESLVDEAFSSVARKKNAHFVINPITKASFAQFLRFDTQSKRMGVPLRTAKTGWVRGFIPAENCPQGYSPKPLYVEIDKMLFWISHSGLSLSSEQAIFALADSNGRFVTSDVDVVSIGIENDAGSCLSDPVWGELTLKELEYLTEVNRTFQMKTGTSFELCAHGPASRFSRSKRSHLHFPLKAFCPDGSIKILPDFDVLSSYPIKMNPLWHNDQLA